MKYSEIMKCSECKRSEEIIQELQEENRILRSALERLELECKTVFIERDTEMRETDFYGIVKEALKSTPLSQQYQKRQEAMEAVVEAAREAIKYIPESTSATMTILNEKLAALDSLSEREGGVK